MALVYEIIKDAYREANLIPINQSPTLDEQTEALRLLNRFVRSIFGNKAGDKLQQFAVGTNNVVTTTSLPTYNFVTPNYVPLNARLMVNNTAPMTVANLIATYPPDAVVDGMYARVTDLSVGHPAPALNYF